MTSPLRILNLGDEPRDADAITSALREIGVECDTFRVNTLKELLGAIDQGGFDIIFTDRTLPGFDGLTARAIKKDPSSKYTVYVHFTDKKRSIDISALMHESR
jgi:two-component system, cell cycle sensor histidine kinase and response regulator CckA